VKQGRATVDVANEQGDTLLHVACRSNHVSIVQYLVEHCHLNVETANSHGETALHAALVVRSGPGRLDVVRYLVQSCRANVEAMNHDGTLALHMAMEYTSNTVAIIQCLVEMGHARVEAVDDDGNTALHVACRENRTDMARYLLLYQSGSENNEGRKQRRRANVIETRNAAGHTPLLLVVRQEEASLDLVQCLVECNGAGRQGYGGADTSAVDDNGQTALHYCCSSFSSDRPHSVPIAQYLASTSRVEQTDRQGRTALHVALDRLTTNPTIVTTANGVGLILSLVKHLPADFGDETPDAVGAAIEPITDSAPRKRQKV
jgi:ankyrin repeat protein